MVAIGSTHGWRPTQTRGHPIDLHRGRPVTLRHPRLLTTPSLLPHLHSRRTSPRAARKSVLRRNREKRRRKERRKRERERRRWRKRRRLRKGRRLRKRRRIRPRRRVPPFQSLRKRIRRRFHRTRFHSPNRRQSSSHRKWRPRRKRTTKIRR